MKNLYQTWQRPPRGIGYGGFWSLNHVPVDGVADEDEFRWQLGQLHARGMRQVIVWLRAGHAIPYLSERWKAVVEIILDECQRLGMKAWFWDEDPFIQGTARGLTQEHPEFRGRLMTSEVQTIEGGRPIQLALQTGHPIPVVGFATPPHPTDYSFPLEVFAVNQQTRQVVDLKANVGTTHEVWNVDPLLASAYLAPSNTRDTIPYPRADKYLTRYHLHWNAPPGTWEVVSFLINDGFHYYTWVLNTLNPDAVRAWIEVTHEWYWKHFQKYFGGSLAGFYSAEPPHIRWTPKLWDYFQEIKGYDLRPLLPHLRMDVDEQSARVRIDYQEVHSELYARNFTRQVRHWCEKHGVGYMGRYGYEERPWEMACAAGNVMPAIRELTMQVSDLVNGLQIGDRNHPYLSLGANVAYSISRQQGKPTGFECMGPVDWQTSFADGRPVCDWGFMMGADKVWTSNTGQYSVDGYRKFDCPPAQFYQSPEWEYFNQMVTRYDRLSALAHAGKEVRKVALIYPISSFFAGQSGLQPPNPLFQNYFSSGPLRELEENLVEIHQALLEAHIPFDLLDETLLDTATLDGRALAVDRARYETLILPRCTHLPSNRCAVLDRFTKRGGTLFVLRQPKILQVSPWKERRALKPWKPVRVIRLGGAAEIVPHPKIAVYRVAPLPPGVLVRRWIHPDFEALALMNTDEQEVKLSWPNAGENWERWCLDSGARSPAAQEILAGRDIAVFVQPTKPRALPAPRIETAPAYILPLDGEWNFSHLTNVLLLERWGLLVGEDRPHPLPPSGKPFESSYETRTGPLYRQVRMEEKPKMYDPAVQVQFETNQPWVHPGKLPLWLYYRYFFTLRPEVTPDLSLLMETEGIAGAWRLWVNGKILPARAFRPKRVYDVGNRVASLQRHLHRTGFNEIIVAVRATRPSDGLQHPLRIMGDFRVEGHPRLTLAATRPTILTGSWTTQGYPHTSGKARYRRKIELDSALMQRKGRWILDCGEVNDSCRVYVDEQLVGTCLWKPFHFDLTDFIGQGSFNLLIEVANNAGNLIAGETKSSGLIGPVRLKMFAEST